MADNSSNIRAANLRQLGQDPKTRNKLFIVGVVLIAMLVFGALMLLTPSKKAQQGPSTASVTAPPNVRSVPGTSTSPGYTQLVQKNNDQQFEQHQAQNTSVLPTLTSDSTQGLNDTFNKVQPTPPVQQPLQVPAPPVTPQPTEQMPRASQVNNGGASDAEIKALANAQQQFDLYVTDWKFKPAGNEFSYYGQHPSDKTGDKGANDGSGSASNVNATNAGTDSSGSGASNGPSFVRAGTVVPAILITPINSDTPGPILAEITSGPLSGARLIGSFSASESQVVVKFSTLSMVGQPRSFTVQAYAVDQNTSSPGLATDVNHHYLQKYGLLAAAAFVGGYGQAVEAQGTTTVVSPLGGATVTQGQLSNSQVAKAAMGQVGDRLANQIQQDSSNIHPTIKVEGAHGQGGVPIGVMFLSDF
jgi:type IV secretory pathway VirB10-like protein